MTKYQAYYTTTVSTTAEFEAATPVEAQEMAEEFDDFPGLCAHCSGWGQRRGMDLAGNWEQSGAVEER